MRLRSSWRLWSFLKYFLVVSVIIFLWSVSLCAVTLSTRFSAVGKSPDTDALMTVLFGASSIALFLFSVIFSFLGIMGWQSIRERLERVDSLERAVQRRIAHVEQMTSGQLSGMRSELSSLEERIVKPLRSEMAEQNLKMRALTHSNLGFALGEVGTSPPLKVKNRYILMRAIEQCQIGYDMLQEFRGSALECLATNNLIFYLSFIDIGPRRDFVLQESRRLLVAAQAHNHVNFMLTAARALLKFSSLDSEKQSAAQIISAVISNPSASRREKAEARSILSSL